MKVSDEPIASTFWAFAVSFWESTQWYEEALILEPGEH